MYETNIKFILELNTLFKPRQGYSEHYNLIIQSHRAIDSEQMRDSHLRKPVKRCANCNEEGIEGTASISHPPGCFSITV